MGLSSCGPQALRYRLNNGGARAQLLRRMWGLPRSGLKSVSPAPAGGFFTTEPPGKPHKVFLAWNLDSSTAFVFLAEDLLSGIHLAN